MREGWREIDGGSVEFIIPSLPPSVNKMYQILFRERRVIMHRDVVKWKTDSKLFIKKLPALEESFIFYVQADFEYNFFYKNGKIKKFDTQNLLKVLIDAIAEKNGMCDSLFKFGSWESYHNPERELVRVRITQVTNE